MFMGSLMKTTHKRQALLWTWHPAQNALERVWAWVFLGLLICVAAWCAGCQAKTVSEAADPVKAALYVPSESLAPPVAEPIPWATPTRTLYVDAAASPGGDGSESKPLQTLDAVWEARGASDDAPVTQVMVAAGRYEISSPPASGSWWVRGASPAQTIVSVATPESVWSVSESMVFESLSFDAAVYFKGAQQASMLMLRDVVANEHKGIALDHFAQVTLEKVALTRTLGLSVKEVQALRFDELSVNEAVGTAVQLFKTRATGRGLKISGVVAQGGQGGDGVAIVRSALTWRGGHVLGAEDRALAVKFRSEAEVDEVSLESKGRAAFYADVDSKVSVRRSSVRGGLTCVLISSGAALTLKNVEVGPCLKQGVVLRDRASGVVKGLRAKDCPGGHVSVLGQRVRLDMSGSRLSGAQDICVLISASDGPVRVYDNEISACKASGVAVLRGRDVKLSRNTVESVSAGLTVKSMANGVSLVDSEAVVEGNVIQGMEGLGVSILRSEGRVVDNEIRRTGSSGINLVGLASADAHIELRGNTVEDTGGPGVMAAMDVNATIKGNTFVKNFGGGVRIMPGVGEVVVEDNQTCDVQGEGEAP